LNGGEIAAAGIEEVKPVQQPYFAEQYASWKQTRAGLRKIV
jgi:hypothetical protein